MKIFVTGGAGFIGSALIRYIIKCTDHCIVNLDKLSYAVDPLALQSINENYRYAFVQADICSQNALIEVFRRYKPDTVMHLAAESHVDNSIISPRGFIETNIIGTFNLLEAARAYWSTLRDSKKDQFRLHHISTDEVYGDLGPEGAPFLEKNPYEPSSPYSASKASSDHLVRAWHRTYKLPIIITNCSNNYGPFQHQEKLIPFMIKNALSAKALPIYGKGDQVRDWLYVEDHVRALIQVLTQGQVGETYNIGGNSEKTNLEVVSTICAILDSIQPKHGASYSDQILHIEDRPGHDQRYAIDASKIENELRWTPTESFETGIEKTVKWYVEYHNTQKLLS